MPRKGNCVESLETLSPSLIVFLLSASMMNSMLEQFGQLHVNCLHMVENAHHARIIVLISEHSLVTAWTTQKQKEVSKFTNNQHLSTPQKQEKMKSLTARAKEAEKEVKRVQHIIERSVEANGTSVDPNLHNDQVAIMEDKSQEINEKYPTGTFKNLFWEQQLKAAKDKGSKGFRWHPMMIRWCLNLKMVSSAAYHAMRSEGFVTLPSERTLQDYSNFFQSKPGFQHEVNKQLMREAKLKELDDLQRHVVLVFDEMKIKKDLVFNKNSAEVIGFVNMGDMNNQLSQLEACKSDKPQRPKICKTDVGIHG